MNTPPAGLDTEENAVKESNATETQIILAADMLPQEIYILPGYAKPVFPEMVIPLVVKPGPVADILRDISQHKEKLVGIVLAREELDYTNPKVMIQNLYRVGTVATLMNFEEAPDGSVKALLRGVRRFEILQAGVRDNHIMAHVIYLKERAATDDRVKAMVMAIMSTMRDLMKANPMFGEEIRMFLQRGSWDDAGRLADFSVSVVSSATRDELQEILEELDVGRRLEKALFLLRKELDLNELKEKITHQIEEKISKQQRDFFLHEQLKAIKAELGLEKDAKTGEIERFEKKMAELDLPESVQSRMEEELEKFKLLAPESAEFSVVRNYLDWLTALPWGVHTTDTLDVKAARRVLDRDHFGLEDVKDRILEFIGVSKLRGSVDGSILCLIGPPGVGKTSLGRAVAQALGRKFYRFSVGGMRDESEIKGHRRTYIGALPGKLIQALRYTESQNPVIMIDEIEKMGASYQGDPASALLEVLDPEQNQAFVDHYLDVPFDLSKVLFIATANVLDTIPGPLLDRMEVIRLSGYIELEKLAIAKRHLIRRLLPKHGLTRKDVHFTDAGIRALIRGYAREAGVRALEKAIRGCLRKIAMQKAEEASFTSVTVSAKKVDELLGMPLFPEESLLKQNQPGVIMGLAWTSLGGTVLFIEAMGIPGKYGLKQTGQLGDVMVESATIAFSMIHSNAESFDINPAFFERHTIHLHVPAGATPKDGPSAGVTMATAIISLATGKIIPAHTAMTGELTLTGSVLPVGGIREKVIAAVRSGIRDIILPKANTRDFNEIPGHITQSITPHFVETYKQVFSLLFKGRLIRSRSSSEG